MERHCSHKYENECNAPRDEWMEAYANNSDERTNVEENKDGYNDDDDDDYCNDNPAMFNDVENVDWHADAKELNMTSNDILNAKRWLHETKKMEIDDNLAERMNSLKPENLNSKQKLAYDYVRKWLDHKFQGKKIDPLYLDISGGGGTGKSTFLMCLRKYILENLGNQTLSVGAFTADAAFNVSGATLHSILKLPINL